jgi:CheY-like chemotaxis protein
MGDYVLVVDDDPDLRQILCEVIREAGVPCVATSNGKEALAHLTGSPAPALILLDLEMPIMDGRAFRVRQLADPAIAEVPVAVLSADDRSAEVPELNGTIWLHKPIDLASLLDIVGRHVPLATPPDDGGASLT